MAVTSSLSPRQAQIMGILANQPAGINITALAGTVGLGAQRTGEVLRMLRDKNLVKCSGPGASAKWFSMELFNALKDKPAFQADAFRRNRLTRANLKCFCEDDGACWLWTGSVDKHGYPKTQHNGKGVLARRVIFEMFHGEIKKGASIVPAIGKEKCDRRCVKPSHLQQWTRSELLKLANESVVRTYADMARVRRLRGTSLDLEKARAIRASSSSTEELASLHGVCTSTILKCKAGKYWREAVPQSSVFNLALCSA